MKFGLPIFILSMLELLWPTTPTQPMPTEPLTYQDVQETTASGYAIMSSARIYQTGEVAGVSEEAVTPAPAQVIQPTPFSPTATPGVKKVPTATAVPPTTTPRPLPSPTSQPFITPTPEAIQMEAPSSLQESLNNWRRQRGKAALSDDDTLCALAERRAGEASGNFSHDGFFALQDEGGFDSFSYELIAENLWTGTTPEPDRIVSGWSESEGHRKNMEGDFSHGCGAIVNSTAAYLFMKMR